MLHGVMHFNMRSVDPAGAGRAAPGAGAIEYSLLERTVEQELVPMALEFGLGITPSRRQRRQSGWMPSSSASATRARPPR